jgi:ADP-heptose:LPS heptosyltransferase
VRSYGFELFAKCPHIDRLVDFKSVEHEGGKLPWMPSVRGANRLGNSLREYLPGLVFHAYRSDTLILPILAPTMLYHETVRRIPARTKIGISGHLCNQSAAADRLARDWYTAQYDASGLPWNFPEMEATRNFLHYLGISASSDEIWPEFWTTEEDRRAADRHVPKQQGRIILGIAPGVASNPQKRLPPEWFAQVIRRLDSEKFELVLIGSNADVDLCEEIARSVAGHLDGHHIINLAGKTSVREMIECLNRCDLVLSQDNASLHVATALRKPVVGIVGGGLFGRFYPWGDEGSRRVVHKPMDCFGCHWACKFETIRCLQEIPPADAVTGLNELSTQLPARNGFADASFQKTSSPTNRPGGARG